MDRYIEKQPRDFLAVATPGAGKTTFALTLASYLLHSHVVQQITVVAPTEHLKKQWAEAAARIGIRLDPTYSSGRLSPDYQGIVITYAGVGVNPMLHRNRVEQRKTLVILDEIHHAGDSKSWGEACAEAFEPATRRLALTGTPFRSDTNPIPFVAYEAGNDGIRKSVADYTYGYGNALGDHVVRPVIFLSYSGNMRWRTKAGDEVAARLGEPMTKDAIAQAWRTALAPQGDWMPNVLRAADKRLTEVRKGIPDAGGLVIATDQNVARAYAKMIREITGEKVTLVLSDEAEASQRITDFSEGDQRWMVAVRMVSEGVDVPRLAVGVYATSISTPLFFAQAVGRFVRARKRGETTSWTGRRPRRTASSTRRTPCSPRPRRPRTRPTAAWTSSPGRRWSRTRSSTGCCTTATSSACRRTPGPRRRRSTSGFPGCSNPTRCRYCCSGGRPGRSSAARPSPPRRRT